MGKGPKGEKRAADLNRRAFDVVRLASGEVDETPSKQAEAGRQGGLKGGQARADSLSQTKRAAIAKKAARARWSKKAD